METIDLVSVDTCSVNSDGQCRRHNDANPRTTPPNQFWDRSFNTPSTTNSQGQNENLRIVFSEESLPARAMDNEPPVWSSVPLIPMNQISNVTRGWDSLNESFATCRSRLYSLWLHHRDQPINPYPPPWKVERHLLDVIMIGHKMFEETDQNEKQDIERWLENNETRTITVSDGTLEFSNSSTPHSPRGGEIESVNNSDISECSSVVVVEPNE